MTMTEATDTPVVDVPTVERIGKLAILMARLHRMQNEVEALYPDEVARAFTRCREETLKLRIPWAQIDNHIGSASDGLLSLIHDLAARIDGE